MGGRVHNGAGSLHRNVRKNISTMKAIDAELKNNLTFNPFHIGVFNKPKGSGGGGGQICPPMLYGYREIFSLFFFIYLSLIGYQGLESKSIAFYMKNCKSHNSLKNRSFGRKSEKIENSLFKNRTFHPKNVRQN